MTQTSESNPVSADGGSQRDRLVSPLNALTRMLSERWRHGSLTLATEAGKEFCIQGLEPGPSGRLILRHPRVLRRLFWSGDIGFAEGFFAGEWDTPDLAALLHSVAVNMGGLERMLGGGWGARLRNRIRHLRNTNSRLGARRNIAAHYDLGNAFYERWLDPSMTYSAARFDRPGASLTEAQRRKYESLAEAIALRPSHRLLEIGCGWGGFAEFAAREIGARVTAITISPAQHAYASARMQAVGLNEKVDIRLVDYRDVEGQFDRVASIEMIEAVGERYWPAYFRKIHDALMPGGVAGVQAITIDDSQFPAYRNQVDFIQKYVFPGGMLPAESCLRDVTAAAGLTWRGAARFGGDYARTLSEWSRSFSAAWTDICEMGFDERFRRLWLYYLAYCEAGFRSGRIDVMQFAMQRS